MDARQERGLQLAQRGDIVKHANGWKVRSQSGNGSYFVHLEDKPSCTFPDFELRGQKCKHVYAVESWLVWETVTDNGRTTTTKTQTVRITYKQNWPVYNAAQTEEKERFIVLLDVLCQLVNQPVHTNGRPFSQLITLSSLPLKGIENNFAVDSSGFSTCRFVRWYNKRYGHEVDNREWVKAHLMCGGRQQDCHQR